MSSLTVPHATRRALSDRQARTVQRLCEAVVAEVRTSGYDGLTVRSVAKRAGVASATAYTYFASKEHLLTEAYRRALADLPEPDVEPSASIGDRVAASLRPFAELAEGQPDLVAACTVAMVTDDPEVAHVREAVGAEIHRRFTMALGPDRDHDTSLALDLAMTGALLRAGTGHMTYAEIPALMGHLAQRLVRGKMNPRERKGRA